MVELCHRCHGELPVKSQAEARGRWEPEPEQIEAILFCPHCSAPQLRLAEHMVAEVVAAADGSTGAEPPPNPRDVDWRLALQGGAGVTLIGVLLTVLGLGVPFVAFLGAVWVMGCGFLAVSVYGKRGAGRWIDGRVGMRLGLSAGLMLAAGLGLTQAGTATVRRFVTHSAAQADVEAAKQYKDMQAKWLGWMKAQGQSDEALKVMSDAWSSPQANSPEFRAASALVGFGMQTGLLVLWAMGSGALAGSLRRRAALLARQ